MKVEQISIFLENKSGRLADVTDVLAKAGINIRALSMADTSDFGILRLILDDTERAKAVLGDSGFTVGRNEVVAVEVPDKPGGMAGILHALRDVEINVEYMYAFVQRSGDNAIVIFRFDDIELATKTLRAAGIRVLGGEEVNLL